MFAFGCLFLFSPLAFAHTSGTAHFAPQLDRAAAVKQIYQIAWDGYKQYAFPHDQLLPLSNSYNDDFDGWSASAVDGLDTAIVMGLGGIVDEILDQIKKTDYTQTVDAQTSLFETTIRYLGGLLSAYDMLHDGPACNLTTKSDEVDALLQQAKTLADTLKFAFDTPTGIPYNNLAVANKSSLDVRNGLATTGSLVMEWTHLSDLLNDQSYSDLAKKGESYLLNPQYAYGLTPPWQGLRGTRVNISNGVFLDASGGWNGGDDSYYEYLIKMWVYDSDKYSNYRDSWIQAADSTIEHLASHPNTRPDLTYLASFVNRTLYYDSGHLACFDGGNFILAGSVLKESKYVDFGLSLVDSCYNLYNSTVTKIGPEGFNWTVTGQGVPANQSDFYNEHGFWITDSSYILRPEVMESYYYAWRVTGLEVYREYAWEAIQAINSSCRAGSGYAELQDVNSATPGYSDTQDTFFFAEVLKYAYLIFAPNTEYQVNFEGQNGWVYNTEAHPFKVAGTPV